MHKMHKKSAYDGQMKAIGNTFYYFFNIFIALLKFIYYNKKDLAAKIPLEGSRFTYG